MSESKDPSEPTVWDLIDDLETLEDEVMNDATREQVEDAIEKARRIGTPAVFGRVIQGFDRADLAEATVGALIFGIPMFVEGGTNEVGAFIAAHPPAMVFTALVAVGLTIGIVYVAEFQDVRVHQPLFGFIPRRMVGILGASAVTAAVMMTAWGRIEWADPWLAVSQILVAMVPMSLGGALGDILPGS